MSSVFNESFFDSSFMSDLSCENNLENQSPVINEKLATFLRIRPLENISIEETPYKIINFNQLSVEDDGGYKSGKNSKHVTKKVYNFTEILDASANQFDVFSKCCLPLVNDVINGTNAFLFCYGTTSSGKSYTMRGPHDDPTSNPGLIPLSLKHIFTSRKFIDEPLIGKSKFCDISLLDQEQQVADTQFKDSILSSSCCRNVSAFTTIDNSSLFNEDGYQYICYLSYFEIYNGLVYDLLIPSSGGRGSALSLFPDDKQRYFVKDLKSVMVSSLTEALQIYSFGWTNLQRNIQETCLNKNSSRSHSFLCISLIKFKEDEGKLLESQVSHLTLGDLAGSERQNKTHSEGLRIKEGGNINVSLMHLKECINQTKLSQKNPNRNFVIPFRNSSLTKFFQPYLTGNGKVWVIVNINPSPNLLNETCGSLDLGETASHISVNSTCQLKYEECKKRMTQLWLQSSRRWSSFAGSKSKLLYVPEVVIEEDTDSKDDNYCSLVQDDDGEKMEREDQIRNEVIQQFEEILSELAKEHEKDILLTRDNYEKTMEARLALSDKKYSAIITNMQARIDLLNNELFDARETIVHLEEEMAKNSETPKITTSEQEIQTEDQFVCIKQYEELRESYERKIIDLQAQSEANLEKLRQEMTQPIIVTHQQECQTEQQVIHINELEMIQDGHSMELKELREILEKEVEKKLESLRMELEEARESYERKIIDLQVQSEVNLEKVRQEMTQPIIVTHQQECQTEQQVIPINELETVQDVHAIQLKELRETLEKEAEDKLLLLCQELTKPGIITVNQECQTDQQVKETIETKVPKVENYQPTEESLPQFEVEMEIDDPGFVTSPKRARRTESSLEVKSTKKPKKDVDRNVSVKKSREITIDASYLPASVAELTKKKKKEESVASPSTEITNEYLRMFCPASATKKSVKKSAKKQPRKSTKSLVVTEPEEDEDGVEDDELASLLLSRKKDKKKKNDEESAVKIPTKRKRLPVTDAFLETTISPHFEDEPPQEQNIKGGRVLRPRRKIKF